jgi:hypothetical protein
MWWLWLNVPLMVAFFAAWVGIPAWMVCRRPDERAAFAAVRVEPQAVPVPDRDEQLAGV